MVNESKLLVRNTTVLAVTAASVVAVFLYPTSHTSRLASPKVASSSHVVPRASDQVLTGPAVKTEYGPVQVQLRIRSGKVVDAEAVQYPKGYGLDDVINSRAIPKLNKEVLSAQSAHIDAASGATYTSGGYLTSLQGAIDMRSAS